LRFLTRRRVIAALSIIALVILVLAAGALIFINSPGFEAEARRYIVREIARRTGAGVSLEGFSWNPWKQHFTLDNLTIRGVEPTTDPPLATFPRIDVGLSLRSLLDRKINLFELTITNPEFHITVDENGRTNFPNPPGVGPRKSFDFEIAIQNFRIVQATTFLNERQIDATFALRNLGAELSYQSLTGILTSHLHYDGEYVRTNKPIIPYTFDADMDYTRGTLLPYRMSLQSGPSLIKLQGRINNLLHKSIQGRLEYTGNVQVPFLNYFFPNERFAGNADVAGYLEFSDGYFFTRGNTAADSVLYNEWQARDVRSEYTYRYPDKRAWFRNFGSNVVGGRAKGNVMIDHLPGPSRVNLDIEYTGVDGAALARAYPWDDKYRIYSRLTGTLKGWFEGRFDRYAMSGHTDLRAYSPVPARGIVPLALDGSTDYEVTPGQARVANADILLGSTHVRAGGLIHPRSSDLNVSMESSDLRDAYFIYDDANGAGTFTGSLTGPIKTPVLNGTFTLHRHVYHAKWPIEDAAGHVNLNTLTRIADLENVRVTQGRSSIAVAGRTSLDGSSADLNIQATSVHGEDLLPYYDRKVQGLITVRVRLTSFNPVKIEGDLRADNLAVDNHEVGNARSHIRYFEPEFDLTSLSIARNGSSMSGNISFNRSSEALKFSTRVSSVDFDSLRWLGLPEELKGTVQQADLQGNGTFKEPNIRGSGVILNLSYKTEILPQVHFDVTSAGSMVNSSFEAGRGLVASAEVNTATKGYPFTAKGTFTSYPIEKLAGLSQATVTTTGDVSLSGLLADLKTVRGQGRVESAGAVIQGKEFRTSKPFAFDFSADQLRLSDVTLTGEGTEATFGGIVGLTKAAPLSLDAKGRIDLTIFSAANSSWTTTGTITVDGQIRGTVQNPDVRGIAHFSNASIGRRGFFTSLNGLDGDLFFDENRVTFNNLKGQVGGGTLSLQGTAELRRGQIQTLNVRIDTNSIRMRYPEGLRTVASGSLLLHGGWPSPVLEGNLQIENMVYKSSFEEFLGMLQGIGGRSPDTSGIGSVRLAIHVVGGKNITIENELANVEARVDLDIKGSLGNPALTGHLETSGGTLSFQGRRYTLTRGTIDFIDPLKIEPVFDIQAESDIRDYRIVLAITGRGDRIRVDTRSDPPLPQIEVINLIAGGKTREELAQQDPRANVTQEQLFKGTAASVLSDILEQRIGGSAFQRLGIARVRIGPDPSIVSSHNQTTLRLTVEEQFSKDLTVTYSRELSSNRQDTIQVEYFVNRSISIIASKDEFDEKGLDIKFRKRLK